MHQPASARGMLEAGLAAVRARWWLALACAVAAGAAIAVYNGNAAPEARVLVEFTPTNIVQAIFNEPRQDGAPPTAGDLERPEVLSILAPQVRVPAAKLSDYLRVEQTGNEREAVLVAAGNLKGAGAALPGDDESRAVALANQWATAYVEYRQDLMRRTLASARREVRARADKLLREGGIFQRREILRSLLAVKAAEKSPPDTQIVRFEGVTPRDLSLSKSLLLIFLVGVGSAVLVALLDGRLRTAAGVEASTGLPVLAAVDKDIPKPVAPLRNQLFLSSGSSAPAVTLLTGTDGTDSDGPFALAHALGGSFAADKRTVVVLDVVEVTRSNAALQDVLERRSPSRADKALTVLRIGDVGSLATPELWARGLKSLSNEFEAIVLAAPDLTRASVLGSEAQASAPLIVCTEGSTRAAAAERAAAAGRRLGKSPTGAVLIKRRWAKELLSQALEEEACSQSEDNGKEAAVTAPRRRRLAWRGLKPRGK